MRRGENRLGKWWVVVEVIDWTVRTRVLLRSSGGIFMLQVLILNRWFKNGILLIFEIEDEVLFFFHHDLFDLQVVFADCQTTLLHMVMCSTFIAAFRRRVLMSSILLLAELNLFLKKQYLCWDLAEQPNIWGYNCRQMFADGLTKKFHSFKCYERKQGHSQLDEGMLFQHLKNAVLQLFIPGESLSQLHHLAHVEMYALHHTIVRRRWFMGVAL